MPNPTIIFVDDDFICNHDICEILNEADFTVVTAYCATAAFDAIAKGDPLSGLVTDIDLGPGADGFEVARRARAAYPDLPIIYISGTAAGRHPFEGVSDSTFLSKPCSPQQIVAALNRAIRLEAA
ncbi:MAG: response regulator [Pseudomonadota bacterium]